ncbi:uncharacterized protein BJX67DRAFT_341619, partial [Aspergillus lucknowensis]
MPYIGMEFGDKLGTGDLRMLSSIITIWVMMYIPLRKGSSFKIVLRPERRTSTFYSSKPQIILVVRV